MTRRSKSPSWQHHANELAGIFKIPRPLVMVRDDATLKEMGCGGRYTVPAPGNLDTHAVRMTPKLRRQGVMEIPANDSIAFFHEFAHHLTVCRYPVHAPYPWQFHRGTRATMHHGVRFGRALYDVLRCAERDGRPMLQLYNWDRENLLVSLVVASLWRLHQWRVHQ